MVAGKWPALSCLCPFMQGVLLLAKEKYRKISDCDKACLKKCQVAEREMQIDWKVNHGKLLLRAWTQLTPRLHWWPLWLDVFYMLTPTGGFPLSIWMLPKFKASRSVLERKSLHMGRESTLSVFLWQLCGQWGHCPSSSSWFESILGRKTLNRLEMSDLSGAPQAVP